MQVFIKIFLREVKKYHIEVRKSTPIHQNHPTIPYLCMKFNNMNRYLIAFWMLLTMSALCLAGLTYIASDLFQVVALSFLFSCFFGSAWYNLGKYYNQQAIR